MEISQARFDQLRETVQRFLNSRCLSEDDITEHYHARGISLRQARRDCLRASGFPVELFEKDGVSDESVDNAMAKILYH